MKKCAMCGQSEMVEKAEELKFSGVAVVNGVVYTCQSCGERYESFANVEVLSRAVSQHIARRVERLTHTEIRFLRTYLGYSSKDFASFLGVAPETVSRWESASAAKPMPLSTEKLLRIMALNDKPISDYGLETAGSSDAKSYQPHFHREEGRWVAAS